MSTETAAEASTAPAALSRPGDGQSYLIGETIYLRGQELGDAKWATAWRPSPFPISAEKAEEQLKKSAPEDDEQRKALLIACRRDDGRPVGSARIDYSDPVGTWISLHADPALGEFGAQVQAEMLGQVVPWISGERFKPVVAFDTDVDLTPVVAQAEALGMRPAVCLRQGIWRDGKHRDQIFYELLHPGWVARLGDPGPGLAAAGEPVAMPKSLAPRRDPGAVLPLPPNALIGSERLALRPMQIEDAETIANLIRAEPDASFGHSRFPYSPVAIADWFGKMGESDPANDVEFAVVLRDTGELIAETGLYEINWVSGVAESGYWIYRAENRGLGYGTEANLLLLEYAFERLGLNMIYAWVKERNPRSQAALRKQGYRDAGRFTWSGYGPDGFENALMFDLLASEWRAWRG
ncbi:MAG: GNAT family N-acetyltransferase [Thermomicrobiales bacterium]